MTNSTGKRPSHATAPLRPPPIPRHVLRAGEVRDRALPRTGDVVASKYRIERLLGRGGMGAVFEASHMLSGKRVAVKWMLPSARDAGLANRFLHEARATARIDHPNVVDIYDIGKKDDSVYLVMELLHGESLASRLERAPMAVRDVVAVLMPALRGVAAAHAQGVIHRDLKPDNIFLCTGPDGETRDCKVLDFGISKITEECELSSTKRGTVMGTPYYMSPEQLRGLTEVDERGDVYAFGVILYEMFADRFPFDDDSYDALVVKISTADPVPLQALRPELDPGLCAVVMRAMARDRGDRYRSVEALARALLPYAEGVRFQLSIVPPAASVRATSTRPIETVRTQRAKSAPLPRAARAMLWVAVALLASSGLVLWLSKAPPAFVAEAHAGDRVLAAQIAAPHDAMEQEEQEPAPMPAVSGAKPAPKPAAARTASSVGQRPAAALRPVRRKTRAAERRAARSAVAAERARAVPTERVSLPRDWDERLTVPVAPRRDTGSAAAEPGAGTLSASDL